jgi:hypothetical protein
MGLPTVQAAVLIDESNADQSGNLLFSDVSEFWELCHQSCCGEGADTRDGA